MLNLALPIATALFVADMPSPQPVDVSRPTAADVLAMAAKLPNVECAGACVGVLRGAFARKRDAPEIAQAIADGVAGEDEPWRRAAQATVYAAYESGMRACPRAGDGGHSHGAWQEWTTDSATACVPRLALPIWLGMVKASERDCVGLPEAERLAELASGRCDRGRGLARRRDSIAKSLLQ